MPRDLDEEGRFACPECGGPMGPSSWVTYKPRASGKKGVPLKGKALAEEKVRDALLARHYCAPDCLLAAVGRGYARQKVDGLIQLMQADALRRAEAEKGKKK